MKDIKRENKDNEDIKQLFLDLAREIVIRLREDKWLYLVREVSFTCKANIRKQ